MRSMPTIRTLVAMGLAMSAGCAAGVIQSDGERQPDLPELLPGQIEVAFEPTDEDFANPERGLFSIGNLVSGYDFALGRRDGSTVSYVVVRLDAFRDSALPASLLASLDDGFARARAAGVKVLVRFVYNFEAGGEDAPLPVVLGHLDQLAPVLHDHADVIVALQAGLIGAWGEWHSSTSGLDEPAARRAIVEAALDALPPSRTVLLRAPMDKAESWAGPMTAEDAFSGSPAGRIGHHNDCFLASDSDKGTYADPIETWKDYVAHDGRYVPVVAETCRLNPPRSECQSALAEMARLHTSLLARAGSREVWDSWRAGGCVEEISRRLGYRFRLIRARLGEAVAPGGVLAVELHLHNDGFAAPFNPRPVHAVLEGHGRRLTAALELDPRRWAAGEDSRLDLALRLPADLPAGDYRLSLWLPDPEPALADRPDYAIRFANREVWDAAAGTNTVATIVVDPTAPGDIDPAATELVALP
jgi:hypothetical protein